MSENDIAEWFKSGTGEDKNRTIPAPTSADEVISQPFSSGNNPSDPNASNVDIFKNPNNHVNASSSVLTFCSNETGFHPATQDISESAETYDAYIQKVSTFPGFALSHNDTSRSLQTSIDAEVMIADIESVYEGVLTVDVKGITSSMQRMAQTVLSQSEAEESKSLFNQMSVNNVSSSGVEIGIFYTTFSMKKNTDGKKVYTSQSYFVSRTVFLVNSAVLVANAEQLAQKIIGDPLDNWLNGNSSSTGSVTKTCFGGN